jgi:hypothetical protein
MEEAQWSRINITPSIGPCIAQFMDTLWTRQELASFRMSVLDSAVGVQSEKESITLLMEAAVKGI